MQVSKNRASTVSASGPAAGRKKTPVLVGGALVLLLAVTFFIKLFFKPEPAVSGPRPVVVMPFENQTGDASLDYLRAAIPNLLITNLEQSKYLTVLTWERMRDLLKQLDKDSLKVIDIDRETGFELCHLADVHGIVLGSFTRAGEVFATDIKVLDVHSKQTLRSANTRGRGVGSILEKQIDALTKDISRVVVGLPERAAQENLRVADVTTSSIEAYRHYLEGVNYFDEMLWQLAEERLQKALALDPSFAMAYYYLATLYDRHSKTTAAHAAFEKAGENASQATFRESLYIRMDYAQMVENDLEKAIRINEELVQKFPRGKTAFLRLSRKYRAAGRIRDAIASNENAIRLDPTWAPAYNQNAYLHAHFEEYDKALEFLEKYIKLSPDKPNGYDSLADILLYMGRLDDAIAQCRRAFEVDSTWLDGLFRLTYIYAMKDDYAEALRLIDQLILLNEKAALSSNKSNYDLFGPYLKGRLLIRIGRYAEANRLFSGFSTLAENFGNSHDQALGLMQNAWTSAEKGDHVQAQQYMQEWLDTRWRAVPADSLRWQLTYDCVSGLFDAYSGKTEEIEQKLARAKEILPRIQHPALEVYTFMLQNLEGEVMLMNGRSNKAIEVFRSVVWPYPSLLARYSHIYGIPVRLDGLARAYHEIGNLNAAIEEYRKLIKFDMSQGRRDLGRPKNHYYLAKLYDEKNWPGLAIQEYTRFLEIWKDAEEDLPELIDAQARLVKLEEVTKI